MDLLPVLIGLAVLAASVLWLAQKPSKYKLPPGPAGLPILGNLAQMAGRTPHISVLKWANEFGGVYKIMLPGAMFVVVSDPALYLPFLGKGGKELPKSSNYNATKPMSGPSGHVSLFSDLHESPFWKTSRKTLSQCFSFAALKRIYPHSLAVANQLADIMDKMAAKNDYQKSIEVLDLLTRATFDMIGETAFQMQFNGLRDIGSSNEFLDALHGTFQEVSKCFTNPLRVYLLKYLWFLPEYMEIQRNFDGTWKHYARMLEELKSRGEPADDDFTMGAAIMKLKNPETGERMDDDKLMANMAIMLIGGFDTGSSTLSWLLWEIANHPKQQAAIREELKAAGLLHVKGGPAPRALEFSELPNMVHFNAVLKESMRVHPVASLVPSRYTEEELQLGEYTVPAGTHIFIPQISLHNSKHNWRDPDAFMLERWLEDEATAGVGQDGAPPLVNKAAYIPFSEGHRNCIGMNQAYMMARTTALTILSRFWLEVDEKKMGDRQYNIDNSCLVLVMVLRDGCHLKVRPHEAD
eukprot:gene25036-10683_t